MKGGGASSVKSTPQKEAARALVSYLLSAPRVCVQACRVEGQIRRLEVGDKKTGGLEHPEGWLERREKTQVLATW